MKTTYTQIKERAALVIFLLLVLTGSLFAQTNYYVSNTGSNSNNGLSAATAKLTIQNAITAAVAGDIINVDAGTYNEQLLVNKSVTIRSNGASQAIIKFSGTPAGKKTLFDISVPNVTLDNLNMKVDLTKLSSAVIASGTNISNLKITNNVIEAIGSSSTNSFGSYGDRNAISINYTGTTNYRIASGGVSNVNFSTNVITGVVNDGFGVSRYFRSGVAMDEGGGVFGANVIQTINHDLLIRFGNNGPVTILDNICNGGGIEVTDMNAAGGPINISRNVFNAAFANLAAPGTAVLRLRNNFNFINTVVNDNMFSGHEWGISLENYNTVSVDNNSFTPLSTSSTYHHITVNTKSISSNSAAIVQKTISAKLTRNIFNASSVNGGTALSFFNHDIDAASFGTFTIGNPGNENVFNAGIKNVVLLDNQSGASNTSVFPAYNLTIGASASVITTMGAWTTALDLTNNMFDLGSGAALPSALSQDDLFSLENKIQHKTDQPILGLVTVKTNNLYVTTNSFVAPFTTTPSVQRAIDISLNGFIVNVGAGTFFENIVVNKEIEIKGRSQLATTLVPAQSNPDCGGAGGGSLCAGGSNVILVKANNVTIDQLSINGDNPALTSGYTVGGADIDARNGIITDHTVTGVVYNHLVVHHVTVQNIYLRGIYASTGGSFDFNNNTVSNVRGNTNSIALFNFGGSGIFNQNTVSLANDGIASNWSTGTVYSGNTVTNSASGIHTDNNGGSGGNADIIRNNQVSAGADLHGYGIMVFAPYVPVLVKNNSVTRMDVALTCAGQQAAVIPEFTGNLVDGQGNVNSTGVYITTDLFGFGTSNVSANFHNNTIQNNLNGFYLESEAGNALSITANNNYIAGNTNSNVTQATGVGGAGTFSADMNCNWWGTAAPAAINAGISGSSVTHTQWLSNGNDSDPATPGFQPAGACGVPVANAQVTAITHVLCKGGSNGSATITFTDGLGQVNMAVDGGAPATVSASSFTLSGLSAGNHTIIIADDATSITVPVTINEPDAITANYSFTPILCNGGLSMQTMVINGGTAPYTVVNQGGGVYIAGAQAGVPYSGNTYAAYYVLTVTDANGCSYAFSATITQPDPLKVSATATDITCNGNSTVTISATGGTTPYNGTGVFSVTAGVYTYTVTDANGCSASVTVNPTVIADTEKPKVKAPGAFSVVNTPGQCGANIPSIGTPVTSDNCGIASITNDHPSTYYPVGTTIVTWIVTDLSGNVTDTAKQKIRVIDNELPTISATDVNVNNTPGICGANITLASPSTNDNCGVASVTNDHPSNLFPVGSTAVTWTVTDIHGWTKTAIQTVMVTDTEKPLVITQPVTVYLSASGTATVTAAQVNNGSTDNCGIISYSLSAGSFTCADLGNNKVILSATDAAGNTGTAEVVVTVKNTIAPVITPVTDINLCTNVNGLYTIPALISSSICGSADVSYSISGVTNRTGNGNNASGAFGVGVSTITWTVNAAGVSATTTQKVTIGAGASAAPVITVSSADAFCNKVTLTAASAGSNTQYNWVFGNTPVSNLQTLSLGQNNAEGVYQVSVTSGGCTSAAASYTFSKQTLASSYTIIGLQEVELGENNTVASGSIGVTSASGEASFRRNSTVASPGSFVKARKISKNGPNVSISNPIYSAASGIVMPTMLLNTANTNNLSNKEVSQNTTVTGNFKNLVIKKGVKATVSGNTFGTVRVEQGAQVTFTSSTLSIDNFQVVKGPRNGYSYVRFAPDTKVLVSGSVNIGSQVYINPDNYKVTFYLGDKKSDDEVFSVKGGDTKVTANVYIAKGKLKVTGGYSYGEYGNGRGDCDRDDDDDRDYGKGNSYVYMTGLFIAQEVEGGGKNVIWNSFDCSAAPVPVMNVSSIITKSITSQEKESATTDEALKVTVMPNPSTTYFTLKLESRYETPVNIRVIDANGRVVDAKSKAGANSSIQIGHAYAAGTYYAEMIQGRIRKVVQLIKLK